MVKLSVVKCGICYLVAYFEVLRVSVSPMHEHLPISIDDILGKMLRAFGARVKPPL